MTRIAILGTGDMAEALGGSWVTAGHDVVVGGRNVEAAAGLARRLGAAGHGTPADAAASAEMVLTAVPAGAAPALVATLSPLLAGRVVIDCTNPIEQTADGLVLATDGTTSVAQRIADAAPGAHVVKAFNLCHSSVWTLRPPRFEDTPLVVPLCGDDPDAVARVAALVTSTGCAPVACGGLSWATYLEAATLFGIGMWGAGAEPRHAFPVS